MLSLLMSFVTGAFVDLSCHNQILEETNPFDRKRQSLNYDQTKCRSETIVDWSDFENPFRKRVACHFASQRSLQIFETDESLLAEKKNGIPESLSSDNCDELLTLIDDMSHESTTQSSPVPTKNFESDDSILIVASEQTCEQAKMSLNNLLQVYLSEGRARSQLICIDQTVVSQQNPSLIREILLKYHNTIDGIILVGLDLVPFEFYAHSVGSLYNHGMSDLPYGEGKSPFWSQPLAKQSSELLNKIYHEKGFIYKSDSPGLFAFNLNDLIETDLANDKRTVPQKWVTRLPAADAPSIDSFVRRRTLYRPRAFQSVIHARGSQSLYYRPFDTNLRNQMIRRLSRFQQNLAPQSRLEILESSILSAVATFVSRDTTMLVLDEHGNSSSLGDLRYYHLSSTIFLPEILHFDSCTVGAWALADDSSHSLLVRSFTGENPPLVVLASQGIKSMPTIGFPDSMVSDIFFAQMRPGTSFGARQIASFENNLKFWQTGEARTLHRLDLPLQLWHSLSLFGDGSIEF